MATPLRFTGMPADRYWQFEDGQVNLGRLDAQPHDLARLCVAEFGLIYGNDWLVVPLNVAAGSLIIVTEVAYTDTFGERMTIPRAEDAESRRELLHVRDVSAQHPRHDPVRDCWWRRPRSEASKVGALEGSAFSPRRNGEHGMGRGACGAKPQRRPPFPRGRRTSG